MPKVDTVTLDVSQVGRQQLISEVACKFIRTNHGHWKVQTVNSLHSVKRQEIPFFSKLHGMLRGVRIIRGNVTHVLRYFTSGYVDAV